MDAADACLRDLCQVDLPFGGKVVVFGGDLRKTLPIVEHGDRADIVAAAVIASAVWRSGKLQRICLTSNIRAARDPSFSRFLLQIGNGQYAFDLELGPSATMLPAAIMAPRAWGLLNLINFVYDDVCALSQRILHGAPQDAMEALAFRAILTPRNDAVANINDLILDQFPSDTVQLLHGVTSISGGTTEDYQSFPLDYLNSLDLPGLPLGTLRLCPGALVSLMRNIDYENGLCNGTRSLVVRISLRILDVLMLLSSPAPALPCFYARS